MAVSAFAQPYFPAGALSTDSQMDRFRGDWYSQELAALHEPSLWQWSRDQPEKTTYRFLWLRSFNAPICIRLTINKDETGSIVCKEGNVHGATGAKKLMHVRMRSLSSVQVKSFLDRLDSVRFWQIPSPSSDLGGVDGSEWILEGAKQAPTKWSMFGRPQLRTLFTCLALCWPSTLRRFEFPRTRSIEPRSSEVNEKWRSMRSRSDRM